MQQFLLIVYILFLQRNVFESLKNKKKELNFLRTKIQINYPLLEIFNFNIYDMNSCTKFNSVHFNSLTVI
jgi:hypothetical protein